MTELEQTLKKNVAPLKIKLDLVYHDNVYYIEMDGTETYRDLNSWITKWPSGLEGFGTSFLRLHKITPQGCSEIRPAVMRFTIGSLFDILKQDD